MLKPAKPAGSFAVCAHKAIDFFAGLAMLSFILLLEPQMWKNKVNINIKVWPYLFIYLFAKNYVVIRKNQTWKLGKIYRMFSYDKLMNNFVL